MTLHHVAHVSDEKFTARFANDAATPRLRVKKFFSITRREFPAPFNLIPQPFNLMRKYWLIRETATTQPLLLSIFLSCRCICRFLSASRGEDNTREDLFFKKGGQKLFFLPFFFLGIRKFWLARVTLPRWKFFFLFLFVSNEKAVTVLLLVAFSFFWVIRHLEVLNLLLVVIFFRGRSVFRVSNHLILAVCSENSFFETRSMIQTELFFVVNIECNGLEQFWHFRVDCNIFYIIMKLWHHFVN